jgi:hypothetical protein
VDGDALTAHVVASPSHGTLSFNSDGSFDYTPAHTFYGADTFTYKTNDGTLDSDAATVTVDVTRPWSTDETTDANGNKTVTVYDAKGEQLWSDQVFHFNSQGQQTDATAHYRDGSVHGSVFDPANQQPWSSQSTVYDAQGHLTQYNVVLDDGSVYGSVFDPANQQPWSSANTVYDTHGQLIASSVTYDDGHVAMWHI